MTDYNKVDDSINGYDIDIEEYINHDDDDGDDDDDD